MKYVVNRKIIIIGKVIGIFYCTTMHGVSIVYNLRIAETTKRQAVVLNHPSAAALTLFDQWRITYNDFHQQICGGMGSLQYSPPSFYVRMNFAAARVSEKKNRFHFARTQTDDILFSSGYSHSFTDRLKLTFSGLLGIPTHKDKNLEGIQFGTGHVGLGGQVDGSYTYSANRRHTIMGAARFIHFFPRGVEILIDNLAHHFTFNIGDAIDLFIAHASQWGKHEFETGYNPTFLFDAWIKPNIKEVVDQTNFIRSNFYVSYKYLFLIRTLPSALILGLSYGFDHSPKRFGIKNSVTIWTTWGIRF